MSAEVERRFARMQELVKSVREVRNRYQVDDKTRLDVSVKCSVAVAADFNALAAFIGPLAGIANLTAGPNATKAEASRGHRASGVRGLRVARGADRRGRRGEATARSRSPRSGSHSTARRRSWRTRSSSAVPRQKWCSNSAIWWPISRSRLRQWKRT